MFSYGPSHMVEQKHTAYSEDTGYSPEDLPEATNDRKEWRERVRDIRAGGTTWWWWWWSNPYSVNFRIRRRWTFIFAVFKLHTGWSNAQCVSAPTNMILPTTAGTYHGFNCFSDVRYALQTNTYRNYCKTFLLSWYIYPLLGYLDIHIR